MKKPLGLFAAFLGILLLLTLLWIMLAPKEDSPAEKNNVEKRANAAQVASTCNKEGNTRKDYNLSFTNRQGQTLLVERVKFRNLNAEKAQVFVALSYSPGRPAWAEKKSNFRVLQPTRSNPPQFKFIDPPSKVPGEERYRQSLRGLSVIPEDVGISLADPTEEPINPLFLSISGFATKDVVIGLLAPSDCPVGQNTGAPQVAVKQAKQKKKAGAKKKSAAKRNSSNKNSQGKKRRTKANLRVN